MLSSTVSVLLDTPPGSLQFWANNCPAVIIPNLSLQVPCWLMCYWVASSVHWKCFCIGSMTTMMKATSWGHARWSCVRYVTCKSCDLGFLLQISDATWQDMKPVTVTVTNRSFRVYCQTGAGKGIIGQNPLTEVIRGSEASNLHILLIVRPALQNRGYSLDTEKKGKGELDDEKKRDRDKRKSGMTEREVKGGGFCWRRRGRRSYLARGWKPSGGLSQGEIPLLQKDTGAQDLAHFSVGRTPALWDVHEKKHHSVRYSSGVRETNCDWFCFNSPRV